MARPLKPIVRSGGYYPSAKYTPLVYSGGYTTFDAKNNKPEPSDPLNTFVGSIVRFLAKKAKPIVKLEANFTPIQDLNGYDAPWPPGGGVNKLPPAASYLPVTNGNLTVTPFADGHYHLKKFAGSAGTVQISLLQTLNITTALYYTPIASVAGTGAMTCNLATSENTTLTTAYIGKASSLCTADGIAAKINFYFTASSEYEGDLFPIITKTAATTYAPYSNICPISGHTGCEVVRTGKNLFNLDREIGTPVPSDIHVTPRVMDINKLYKGLRADNYYYDVYADYTIDNGILTVYTFTNVNYGIGFPISCKPNTTYILSAEQTGCNFSVGCYDKDWNYLSKLVSTASYVSPITFTTPNYAAYVTVIIGSAVNGEGTATKIQLELGSTASDYEAYQGTTVSISFGTTVYSGTLTVFEDGSGQIDVGQDPLVFDSSAWGFSSNFFYKSFAELQGAVVSAYYTTENGVKIYINTNNGQCRIYLSENPSITSDSDIGSLLNGYKLLYDLATPITIPLTASQINTLVGNNVVWVNDATGDITVQAYGTEIN